MVFYIWIWISTEQTILLIIINMLTIDNQRIKKLLVYYQHRHFSAVFPIIFAANA